MAFGIMDTYSNVAYTPTEILSMTYGTCCLVLLKLSLFVQANNGRGHCDQSTLAAGHSLTSLFSLRDRGETG